MGNTCLESKMKKILLITLLIVLLGGGTYGWGGLDVEIDTAEEAAEKIVSICPIKKVDKDCTDCHVLPDWTLKEKKPNANRSFPYGPDMNIIEDGKVAYLLITGISAFEVSSFFEYVRWHPEIEKCIFEIYSPGGSLFEAWRIVGMMDLWKSNGMIIETRVHGFAASAGFILFANGTKGHRFASATSELMWHELFKFDFFKVTRPAEVEDEAVVLRHLQTTANNYLAERSNLTSEQWDDKVFKKEFWCNGAEAIEFGLSDGLPGKEK